MSEIFVAMRRLKKKSHCENPTWVSHEFRILNDILQQDRSYYPFRVSAWEDCFKSRISSYFVGMCDEACYQCANRVGTFGEKLSQQGVLNTDEDFDFRQDLQAVNMGQEHKVDHIYRQQFDSISMDYLSQLSLNFDPERGLLLQSIKITSHHTLEQKWLLLFGKYWLLKNMQNDTGVKICIG